MFKFTRTTYEINVRKAAEMKLKVFLFFFATIFEASEGKSTSSNTQKAVYTDIFG